MDIELDKPTHAFDARLTTKTGRSPLVYVELWLPIDCHENARIRVTGSGEAAESQLPSSDFSGNLCRLESEIEPLIGLQIEADEVLIRRISTTAGQRLQGTRITIGHIGRLCLKRAFTPRASAVAPPGITLVDISLRLSAISYGLPQCLHTVDYLGNRKIEATRARKLRMLRATGPVDLVLQRHWGWHEGQFDRLVASSFPVLEFKDAASFQWEQLEEVHQIGRDACLLLTLAARHLTVVHVLVATTEDHQLEEWTYPLNRQRSTTEEEATGPLIDEQEVEDYFLCASARWLEMTDQQRDAVRSAIFAIHPLVQTSMEGSFLQKFAALEGLAATWFPTLEKLAEKVGALLEAFPPRVVRLWPITSASKDGLYAIRNRLAHGRGMRGAKQEALSVGTDHLQVWIEHILLSILGYARKSFYRDWLWEHVRGQSDDLARLQATVKI